VEEKHGTTEEKMEGPSSQLLMVTMMKWKDNIKIDLRDFGWGAWTGLIWLRIGTGGGLL
jgi:hypothetical protein